jgi:hypothetical protein
MFLKFVYFLQYANSIPCMACFPYIFKYKYVKRQPASWHLLFRIDRRIKIRKFLLLLSFCRRELSKAYLVISVMFMHENSTFPPSNHVMQIHPLIPVPFASVSAVFVSLVLLLEV